MSFMQTKNKIEPSIDPFGTPWVMCLKLEYEKLQ